MINKILRFDVLFYLVDYFSVHIYFFFQIVAGQLVYLTVRVGETTCSVGTPDLHVCGFDTTEDSYICEIVVWERSWLNSSKVIDEKSR